MRPIIQNLSEMSDSKEVYDSKPNKVLTIFLLLIWCIIAAIALWMALGKIDEVISSEGIIILSEDVSTVTNITGGKITKIYAEDGVYVNSGDLLYSIDYSELEIQAEQMEKALEEEKEKLNLLYRYKTSVEEDKNYFANEGIEQEYYSRFLTYFMNYKTSQANLDYTVKGNSISKTSIKSELDKQAEKLEKLDKLSRSVTEGKNLFDPVTEDFYYSSYEKYCSDYKNIINNYDTEKQSILSASTAEVNRVMIEYYSKVKSEYETLQKSVKNKVNHFTEDNEYSLKYEEYEEEISNLATQEEKEAYQKTYLVGVASNISAAETELQKLYAANNTGVSKNSLLEINEKNKSESLNTFTLNYKIQLQSSIIETENTIMDLKNQLSALENENVKNVYYESDGETENAQIIYLKQTELSSVISRITDKEELIEKAQEELEAIQRNIEKCTVKAEIGGYVNLKTELVENNILTAGQTVMTILPIDSSEYKVQAYISNKDAGKVKEGMQIKCNIYAFPNKEYGYIYGTIIKLSKDIYTDANGASYYLAEAVINPGDTVYEDNDSVELKVGMRCSVKAITGEKKIYRFVLEKLDLWS